MESNGSHGALVAVGGLILAAPAAMGLILVGVLGGVEAEEDAAASAAADQSAYAGAALNPTGIPAEYVPWILKGGSLCAELTAPMLAAQIKAESDFQDLPPNQAGAAGPAQFLVSTWAEEGLDGDGNGSKDLHSVPDAVMTMAAQDCAAFKKLAPKYPNDTWAVVLANYNAGPGAVQKYGGVPPYTETINYIARIKKYTAEFTAAPVASGAWRPPLDQYVIGAGFGQIGSHWSWTGYHTGTDYIAPLGTPIKAAAAGTVVEVNPMGSNPHGAAWGNQVIIDHGVMTTPNGLRRITTTYNHLTSFAVTVGARVQAGTVIGQEGATGNVTGPHLHFEVHSSNGPFPWGAPSRNDFQDPVAWIAAHKNAPPATTGGNVIAQSAIAFARSQLGKPYVYGTAGPNSYDCSGLVVAAWRHATQGRLTLTRTTQTMTAPGAAHLQTIPTSQAQPGDLFFFNLHGEWDHVGIYLGGGQMLHAPRTGDVVKIVSITNGYYASKPTTVRRVIP